MEHKLRIGELCPVCKKGHFQLDEHREFEEPVPPINGNVHTDRTHYKCDFCGIGSNDIIKIFEEKMGAKDGLVKVVKV
jgi:hypothetical protein